MPLYAALLLGSFLSTVDQPTRLLLACYPLSEDLPKIELIKHAIQEVQTEDGDYQET